MTEFDNEMALPEQSVENRLTCCVKSFAPTSRTPPGVFQVRAISISLQRSGQGTISSGGRLPVPSQLCGLSDVSPV